MGARGVRKTIWTPEIVRERIQASQIANVLIDHVVNGTEMVPSRITAGLGLLKKIIPDLSAMAVTGHVEVTRADELTDSLLAHIASAGRTGAIGQAPIEEQPDEVH